MPENIHRSDDYISFDNIKNIFLDFFRFIFKTVDFILFSIQRRLGLFLFCCLTGLVAGYIFYSQNRSYYKAEMIVQSNDLSKKSYFEIVRNLNDLITTQSYTTFSTQLKINEKVSKEVISIEAISLSNESLNLDTTTKVKEPFKIQLKASNISSIPILQNAILEYLKSSPYLRLIKEGEKRIYTEKLEFIDQEQKKLDSFISDYHQLVKSTKMPATIYNNVLDPATLYQHALKLDSVKEKTRRWLNNESEAILLIDGFKSPENPQSTSLIFSLLTGLAIGVVLGILLVLLAVIKKALT